MYNNIKNNNNTIYKINLWPIKDIMVLQIENCFNECKCCRFIIPQRCLIGKLLTSIICFMYLWFLTLQRNIINIGNGSGATIIFISVNYFGEVCKFILTRQKLPRFSYRFLINKIYGRELPSKVYVSCLNSYYAYFFILCLF